MGVSKTGRFAAVTNYRGAHEPGAPESRGALVSRFLSGHQGAAEYARALDGHASQYSGFNLLLADEGELWSVSNRGGATRRLEPGIYGLGNALLDDPGVHEAKAAFGAVAMQAPGTEPLFSVLEKWRIVNPVYGTRCSTVWRRSAAAHGLGRYAERSFLADGSEAETLMFDIPVPERAF
jgi:uncharacterized protein with NRDE domain